MCWDLANDLAPLHGTSKIEVVSPSTSLTSSTRLTRGITATSTARSFGCSGHVGCSSRLQLLDFWSTAHHCTLRSWSRRLCEEHDHRGFSAGFWWFHRRIGFMGDLQDPKMEVLYRILGHILWGYSLKFRPYISLIYGIGTSNQSVPVAWPGCFLLRPADWCPMCSTEAAQMDGAILVVSGHGGLGPSEGRIRRGHRESSRSRQAMMVLCHRHGSTSCCPGRLVCSGTQGSPAWCEKNCQFQVRDVGELYLGKMKVMVVMVVLPQFRLNWTSFICHWLVALSSFCSTDLS